MPHRAAQSPNHSWPPPVEIHHALYALRQSLFKLLPGEAPAPVGATALTGHVHAVFAIQSELGIPVKLVGLGETADDLIDFDPDEFVDALFSA